MYQDENFTLPLDDAYSDVICNIITYDHIICDYFLIDETVGVFSLFSGIAKLNFTAKESGSGIRDSPKPMTPLGSGRFVFQGGSDLHAGILGRVSTSYGKDIIKHDFCVQGSTYDHIVPPK